MLVKLKELPAKHWLADCVYVEVGCGFTVMVYVTGVPVQPDNVGVTVTVAVIGLEVLLVAVNEGTLVVPLALKPMAVLEFVHAMVAPAGVLVKVSAFTVVPAHTVTFAGAVITGFGFTTTVTVDVQVAEPVVAVTVYVPAAAVVGDAMVGFCTLEEKPFGPDQE